MRSWLRTAALAMLLTVPVDAAATLPPDSAEALLAQHAVLRERLERSPLPQHLYVESYDRPDSSGGDVYGVVDYPIALVSEALSDPADWCDVLILHLNVKYCHPVSRDGRTVLSVAIGRKHEQPLASHFPRLFRLQRLSVAARLPRRRAARRTGPPRNQQLQDQLLRGGRRENTVVRAPPIFLHSGRPQLVRQ